MPRDTVAKFMGELLTAREVLIAREAFVEGAADARLRLPVTSLDYDVVAQQAEDHRAAATCYRLPKVTRPRVAKDPEVPGVKWKVEDGVFFVREETPNSGTGWYTHFYAPDRLALSPTRARVAMWGDLLNYPTEEVDADA